MSREDALFQLLAAARTFDSARVDRDATNASEVLGELVEYLGADEVRREELTAVLGAAEDLLSRLDDEEAVRLVYDLIEDLQLLVSYPDTRLDSHEVEPALLPRCRALWNDIDRLW